MTAKDGKERHLSGWLGSWASPASLLLWGRRGAGVVLAPRLCVRWGGAPWACALPGCAGVVLALAGLGLLLAEKTRRRCGVFFAWLCGGLLVFAGLCSPSGWPVVLSALGSFGFPGGVAACGVAGFVLASRLRALACVRSLGAFVRLAFGGVACSCRWVGLLSPNPLLAQRFLLGLAGPCVVSRGASLLPGRRGFPLFYLVLNVTYTV